MYNNIQYKVKTKTLYFSNTRFAIQSKINNIYNNLYHFYVSYS